MAHWERLADRLADDILPTISCRRLVNYLTDALQIISPSSAIQLLGSSVIECILCTANPHAGKVTKSSVSMRYSASDRSRQITRLRGHDLPHLLAATFSIVSISLEKIEARVP